jgi:succinate dehydrogenase/fumarate reductase cytochrome b subunit
LKFIGSTLYTLGGIGAIGAIGAFLFHVFVGVFLTEWSQEYLFYWKGYSSCFIEPFVFLVLLDMYEDLLDEEYEIE